MSIKIDQSLKEVLSDKELFFAIRYDIETLEMTFETNVDKSDVGHVFFQPLVTQCNLEAFEFAIEITKSLLEALEGAAGKG